MRTCRYPPHLVGSEVHSPRLVSNFGLLPILASASSPYSFPSLTSAPCAHLVPESAHFGLDSIAPLGLKIFMDTHPPSEPWRKILLPIADVLGIFIAFSLAYFLRLKAFNPQQVFSSLMLMFVAVDLICLYLFDLYQIDARAPRWRTALRTLAAIFATACVNILIAYFSGAVEFSGLIGRGVLIGAHFLFAIWAISIRLALHRWLRRVGRSARYLVLGTEENLELFIKELVGSRLAGVFAILTPDGQRLVAAEAAVFNAGRGDARSVLTLQHQGSWQDLESLAHQPWTGIIVCAGNHLPENLVEILMDIRLRGVRVADLADFYEQAWLKVPVYYLQRSWFAMAQGFQLLHNPVGLRLKRVFDFVGALILLILTSPILLLVSIAIKLDSRGPLIFKQTRVGENGKHFTVYKLRSMRVDAERDGAKWTEVGDTRITRVGSFIRATRIDELPQLLNVLRGEMSFIGPRPERPEFMGQLEQEIPFYNLRHILRPGVTGWAQVMYPYGASVEDARQKLQYELYYIKNYSLLLDAVIVLKTVRVVLFGKGR